MANDENPPTLNPGDQLGKNRDWEIEKLLGQGGFGAVYLAKNTKDGTKGAVKIESTKCRVKVLKHEVKVGECTYLPVKLKFVQSVHI